MRKIKNLLLFGGLDKESYNVIRTRISEDNKKTVALFTIISAFFFFSVAIITIITNMSLSADIYLCATVLFVLMFLLNIFCHKKFPKISNVFAILYSLVLLSSGVIIAYNQSNERTTLLLPLFLMASLAFCYRPIYLVVLSVGVEAVYLIIMKQVQNDSLFFINSVNTIIFCLTGIIGGLFTLSLKCKKYKAEYNNQILLETDVLTGIHNRFSCKKEFDRIVKIKIPVTICSMDINDLKLINDTKGHLAGDEVIVGAAQCITEVFERYGKVYRIGGDEFCALIYEDFDKDSLLNELKEKTSAWKGELVEGLSIAVGIAKLDYDYEKRLNQVVHEAEKQMYAEKNAYHKAQKNSTN